MSRAMASRGLWCYWTLILLYGIGLCAAFRPPRPYLLGGAASAAARRSMPLTKIRPFDTFYFTQVLDHFTFKDAVRHPEETFQQRYLVNQEFWHGAQKAGPIFLYCGNEGDIEWFAENTGFLFEIAPRLGALLIFPEHRYYGESMPFGNQERAYKNADSLSYLTTEQALADFATLITDFKKNLSAEASPVVAFGGSYGGMLAAWFRLKYPHIVIGALASSAPILQFENLVPNDIFNKIVSLDFKEESDACFDIVRNSWSAIEALAAEEGGLHILSAKFHLCSDIQDAADLTDWLYSAYSYLAMVNYPYAANFMMPLPAHPIREVCKAMTNLPDDFDILSRIFAGISVYYNFTGEVDCFDLSADPHGMSGWGWQACTEMIMPMSSNPNNSMVFPYGWDLQAYINGCLSTYNANARPNWAVTEFGGQDIKSVLRHFGSNIIFSNGLLDPWSGGSVLEDISSTIIAIITKEGAHHLDLRSSTKEDPGWLVDQRELEISKIRQWLGEFYETLIVI
ncbi:hypothetical protein O6H91_06G056100 [Diphasiastrum complanatum]|uniref:Uncharacterized protein n=1 Tax=Diphasiastrum complanatum TaxID=34168 RepID=A0ACC2DE97_DIPCM|nr:hypothetical protein O6H91_Y237300 [Diphasiastrum complanatum]KAJ7552457.1 hypothetical protein O6H91_06G056100 [Diphasiastrum complanatum]